MHLNSDGSRLLILPFRQRVCWMSPIATVFNCVMSSNNWFLNLAFIYCQICSDGFSSGVYAGMFNK